MYERSAERGSCRVMMVFLAYPLVDYLRFLYNDKCC